MYGDEDTDEDIEIPGMKSSAPSGADNSAKHGSEDDFDFYG